MARSSRTSIPLYLIPIMLGMCGVLFAHQLADPTLQTIVIVLSVGMPLFAVGVLISRIPGSGYQRSFLILGVVMLILGALVTVSGLPDGFEELDDVPGTAIEVSRGLGLGSLLVGLVAILVILAYREEQSEEIAQRFRYLADHMSEGFILTGPDGTITLVNDALKKLTNLKESELLGKNDKFLAQKLELEPMLPHIEDRRRGIASEYHVTWNVGGEERQLWVNGTPLFDRHGRFAGALATIRDVTEQHRLAKRLEKYTQGLQKLVEDRTQKLSKSQQRLHDLLVNMNEGFLTLDESYHIVFANSRICDLLQTPSENLLGRDAFDFVEPAARGRLLEILEDAQERQGFEQHQELALRRPDGQSLPVVVSIAPVEAAPDEEARFSLVLTNVSELKRMQHQLELRALELEEANAELRMLDRAKDSFLSNVSHELRTPLSTIRGYIEMFHSGSLGDLSESQLAALKVMTRNVERLGTLIDEIIEFSRMEIRGIELHLTLFSVQRMLQEAAASVKPQVIAKELTLEIRSGEPVRYMWGDRKRVGQVLAILLSNAIKFSHKGGRVILQASLRGSGIVCLDVEDVGIGIEADAQKRVFDKFFQADSSRTRRYEGAGIGLSIAKTIMDAHGGGIELRSEPNVGSTFTLVFPEAYFDDREQSVVSRRVEPANLLLVAGDAELAAAMRRTLGVYGYETTHVTSGYEAARLMNESDPAFIIVDEEQPSLNPIGTVQHLIEHGLDGDTGVLLLAERSGISEGVTREGYAIDVLYKPFTSLALAARLTRLHEGPVAPLEEEVSLRSSNAHRIALLCIGPDSDLLDWIETALRRRELTCVRAPDAASALGVIAERSPGVVLADLDVKQDEAERLVNNVRLAATQSGAAFFVMTGLGEETWDLPEVAGVLQKPFTTKELVETVMSAMAGSTHV
ncbi:MAG: PAS domain S-box protein [Candidatus Hydrogenedentes bacterium]|nr:PAS domain S-box protein [Candidatus Hydrogenedentota bacterium]